MPKQKEKDKMLEYLVEKLSRGGQSADPRRERIVSDIESSYIIIDGWGALLLVDQKYPGARFRDVRDYLKQDGLIPGFVFYKDGKTFFRSAAPKNAFKSRKGLSLKRYPHMRNIIELRPEEMMLRTSSGTRVRLQYYQPESARLGERVVVYEMEAVEFDYSHIRSGRFRPQNRHSERLFMNIENKNLDGKLRMNHRGMLNPGSHTI